MELAALEPRDEGVDQTMEMLCPGSGSHARTPSPRNHWRAIDS